MICSPVRVCRDRKMASNFGIRGLFSGSFGLGGLRRRKLSGGLRPAELLEMRTLLTNPLTAIPKLDSLPGAPVRVYLDFDGHTETQDWPATRTDNQTGPIVTPVFDVDGDQTTFSDTELDMITEVWYRVSEDFMPFNVNVTTIDPGTYNDFETVLVSIGGNGSWTGSPGGIAFLNAFSTGVVNTCYAFTDNTGFGGVDHMKGTAMTVSHEVGHTLGLNHHSEYDANGNKTDEYNPGTAAIGPIMGAPYGSFREIWVNAPGNVSVTAFQDDFAEMTRAANRTFVFRADDVGDTNSAAKRINVTSPNILEQGVIGQNNDVDVYSFDTDAGPISFSLTGLDLRTVFGNNRLNPGTNGDFVLELRDGSGNVLASDNPSASLNASVSATVAQGTYFVVVSTTGRYGEIGQYTLSGTVIPLPTVPVMLGPSGTLADQLPIFTWTASANVQSYSLEVDVFDSTAKTWSSYLSRSGITGTTFTAPAQFPQGEFRARVRALANNNQFTAYSNYVTFTIDIPAPGIPTWIRPVGETSEPFPKFEWLGASNAVSYTLWVVNRTTGQRVIYRTNYRDTSYTHFAALPDGNYRGWLQAMNSVGELSAWSRPVDFVIDAPVPTAPRMLSPGAVTTSANPRFTWTDVKAARYVIQVNNRTTGQARYFYKSDIPGTQTFVDPTAFAQGVYTVWVQAFNANNEGSPWSAGLTFSVDILPPAATYMTGPVGANGGRLISTLNPTYSWRDAARAVRYQLYVNNVTTGEFQIINKSDITGLSFTSIVPHKQGEIRAWVRAFNSANEAGEWSSVYTFFIDEATPLTPIITGPLANPAGSVDNANPTFTWSIDADAPFFQFELLEVNPNTGALTRVILQNGLTQKSYTVPNAQRLKETSYVARVRGYNNSNEFGAWSPNFNLRIDVPNAVTPTILGPGGTITDTTPTLSWTHNSNSIRYEVLMRDLVRDEAIVFQVEAFQLSPDGSEAYFTIPDNKPLNRSTHRFWIRAFNSMQQPSAWSEPQSFVLAQADLQPQLEQELVPTAELVALNLSGRRRLPQQGESSSSREMQLAVPAELAVRVSAPPALAEQAQTAGLPGGPAELSETDANLIDQALWMLVNPASGVMPG